MKSDFISSIWDFSHIPKGETNYATHDLMRWYGKLIPQLVSRLIALYSQKGDTVLANFAGSGTILVEANILKRNAIGIDSNPLAALVSTVKTRPYIPDSEPILTEIRKVLNSNNRMIYDMDEGDRKWFPVETFQDLMAIRRFVLSLPDKNDRDYFLLALSSIVKKVSRVDARCVNHIVLDSNKPEKNVYTELVKKLQEMKESMQEYIKLSQDSQVEIVLDDARNTKLQNDSIDLIISHPPYLGSIDYTNMYQLENKLLGYSYSEIDANDISTNSMKEYLANMCQVFDEMFRLLKSGHYACVVIGDNRKDGNIQPTSAYFIQYATQQLSFRLRDIFIWFLCGKAGMNVKRRGNHIDHNYILIFQKP